MEFRAGYADNVNLSDHCVGDKDTPVPAADVVVFDSSMVWTLHRFQQASDASFAPQEHILDLHNCIIRAMKMRSQMRYDRGRTLQKIENLTTEGSGRATYMISGLWELSSSIGCGLL